MTRGSVYVVGTFDTKGPELRFVTERLRAAGTPTVTVDVTTSAPDTASGADVSANQVAAHCGDLASVFTGERGSASAGMATALRKFLLSRDDVRGVLGLGGSGGTALITPAMQALPVGVPKLMVSTVASGDVRPYVGASDIAMLYSVTDISGLNRICRRVLGNAAHAMAGMAGHPVPDAAPDKPTVALTMFGVTTLAVTALCERLAPGHECLVFHATGTGGQSMEKLVDSGLVDTVIDLTTTEIADLIVGGVLSATEDRLGAIARTGVPYVGSCGALDMVNFWAAETVPDAFRDRTLYVHNANVTLMRTTGAECRAIGEWIGRKLNDCQGPVRFLLPEGGVSAVDLPGQPFHDPAADKALFDAIETTVEQTPDRRVIRVPHHINDPAFTDAVLVAFGDLTGGAAA
jgi:uncharacterized protein (UPF0261 family)